MTRFRFLISEMTFSKGHSDNICYESRSKRNLIKSSDFERVFYHWERRRGAAGGGGCR